MSILSEFRYEPARTTTPPSRVFAASVSGLRGLRGLREVSLLAALWIVYSASRLIASDDLDDARQRAADILNIERFLHLDIEHWLNHALTPITEIAVPMSFWYASLHYLVTPLVLAFLFFRHRDDYPRARNALVIGSAIGLVVYMVMPTAPPRLMPGGHYLDALAQTAQFGWWSGHASAPAGLGQMTNELAAMPSLHVGWTVWVAWAVWKHTHVVGRAIALTYVAGTTLVVIATGNHWALDALAGAVVVGIGIVVSGRTAARSQGSATAGP